MKPTKCPAREKKQLRQEKQKKKGDMERTRKPENRDQKTARLDSKRVFRQNLQGQMG